MQGLLLTTLMSPGVVEPKRERSQFSNVGVSWVDGMDGIERCDWKRGNLYAHAGLALSSLMWTRDDTLPTRRVTGATVSWYAHHNGSPRATLHLLMPREEHAPHLRERKPRIHLRSPQELQKVSAWRPGSCSCRDIGRVGARLRKAVNK